jgi:hypothetical protein
MRISTIDIQASVGLSHSLSYPLPPFADIDRPQKVSENVDKELRSADRKHS